MARIEHWLADPSARLLTIVGPGGAGQTRLALRAARAHVGDFLEGAWLVALDAASPDQSLAFAIAAAIGFQSSGVLRMEGQLLDFLREKEMLLVLDSAEGNLDHADLALLAALLAQAPDVKWLVTSRERLNLRAESVIELMGLSLESQMYAGNDPSGWTSEQGPIFQSPAGRLFLARARQVRPSFDAVGPKLC